MISLMFAALLAGSPGALAQTPKPPVVDAGAEARAAGVAMMSDTDPVGRLNMLLAAKDLDDAALFALAGTHPGIVEQLTTPKYRQAVEYVALLPAGDLNRARRGETVIRTLRELRGLEYTKAVQFTERFGYKEKKLEAMVIGPYEARIYRVEVRSTAKRGGQDTGVVELAWPGTPERDEQSRNTLAKYFGARPSRTGQGAGSLLALRNGSFDDGALADAWDLMDGTVLGTRAPVGEVVIDDRVALDGSSSLRFFSDEKTRLFPMAVQIVSVQPGTVLRVRTQLKTENVRAEFQQSDQDLFLEVIFMDAGGTPVSGPARAYGRASTHTWELLEVQQQAPMGATLVQVGLLSAMSGTAWFDGVVVEIVQ